jgi:hypothetical protein
VVLELNHADRRTEGQTRPAHNAFSPCTSCKNAQQPPSLCGRIASGASVAPTSRFSSSAILLLPIVGSQKVRFHGSPQWHKLHTKFYPNPSSGSGVESRGQTDGQTRPAHYAFLSCTSCKERIIFGFDGSMNMCYTSPFWPMLTSHELSYSLKLQEERTSKKLYL